MADLAAALLCGFAGGATSSSSSVASTSSALACSSALRLSTFAGDRPLCLESTFCQNSSNSRSVINWLHSRLRDSMLARGAHQTPTVPAIAFLALRTAWTEMTNNRSFAVRRRCLEIAVISILDNQRTHSRSPLLVHGSRGAMPPRRPRALRLRRWRAASAPRRRRRARAARSGPCRPRRPPPPPPPARPRRSRRKRFPLASAAQLLSHLTTQHKGASASTKQTSTSAGSR